MYICVVSYSNSQRNIQQRDVVPFNPRVPQPVPRPKPFAKASCNSPRRPRRLPKDGCQGRVNICENWMRIVHFIG